MGIPEVSGVSPKEGKPGTKVTIRGENLGNNKDDIESITICGKNCVKSLEYVSSKKLTCLTPDVWGAGEIIVTTYSGGRGRCTVEFVGLEPDPVNAIDPMQDYDEWVDEDLDSLTWKISDKNESPVYTRDLTHPLGANVVSSRKTRGGSDNLGDLYQNYSGNLLEENFHPVRHLLERHRYTNFPDLKHGLHNVQMELEYSNQAPVHFMLDNLDAFLQCYDTLSDVNELLIRNESEQQGGSLTDKAEELLTHSAKQAQEIFNGILKSKVRADTTRNALTVLQRYRFLFGLPKNIEKNIRNRDYDPVATDYDRAKSLFCNTQVKAFKKVFEQVEKQIATFRQDLKQQLLVLPSTLDQQKKLIKYLLELDCEGDPAWDCISNMCLWILRLLFTSKEDFQDFQVGRMPGELASLPMHPLDLAPSVPPRSKSSVSRDGHSRTMSDVSFMSTSSYGSQTTYSGMGSVSMTTSTPAHQPLAYSGAGDMPTLKGPSKRSRMGAGKDSSGPPDRIMFVEDITEIFSVTLPDLWKLGLAYQKGSLFQGVALHTEHQKKLSQICEMNKTKFEAEVVDIIDIYTNMVNSALFHDAYDGLSDTMKEKLGEWKPFDDNIHETSGVWLSRIVRSVRECVSNLEGMGLPEIGISKLHNLAMNVRSLCADTLFQCAATDVEQLHEREDWKVHDEEGGLVTSLPLLFEKRVVEVLLLLKEIVNEPQEYSQPEVNQELRHCAKTHFEDLLNNFMKCIRDLAGIREDSGKPQNPTPAREQESSTQLPDSDYKDDQEDTDGHLLILLSNMQYTANEVIPRLSACFMSHGYPDCMDLIEVVLREMYKLDDEIFEKYVSHKSESFSGIIDHGMQVGYFDWEQAKEPTKVRNYIRDILMNLVHVHAEVYAVSSQLVPRVMVELVKVMSKEFYECIGAVESFNANGVIHGYIELAALEDLLGPYIDDQSRKNFELSRKHLGEWDIHGWNRVQQIVEEFKKMTKFQLKCFSNLEEDEDPAVESALPVTT